MRILYTHTSSLIGGGNKVLLSLFARLDRKRFQPISVLPEKGPMELELQKLQVPYFILDLRPRAWNKLTAAFLVATLSFKAIRYGVHTLHANDPFTYRLASIAFCIIGGHRVCHLHHPDQDAMSIRWMYNRVPELILTPSAFVREKVCQWLGVSNSEVVHAVGNPIDIEFFKPEKDIAKLRQRLQILPEGPHIITLGALTPHKGQDRFLRMAVELLRDYPGATFHIVGSARHGNKEYAAGLHKIVSELGISRAVKFWGFLPDDITRDLLCASDLFVLPTKEEGFGLVLAEAQACGVPVLTSSIHPLDEVVSNGNTGWLIPPDDYRQYAKLAAELIANKERYSQFSAAARSFVAQRFGAQGFADRVMDLYETL